MELVGRVFVVGQSQDGILKGEQYPRIDVERQVEVERPPAPLLWVEVHLPNLAERVGLHEMALVVHVESVVDRVVLQVGDVSGDVDGCHRASLSATGSSLVRDRVA
jgi:hypothetical protein